MPRKIYNFVILSKPNLAVKGVFGDVIKSLIGQIKEVLNSKRILLTDAKNCVLKVGKNKGLYAEMFLRKDDP